MAEDYSKGGPYEALPIEYALADAFPNANPKAPGLQGLIALAATLSTIDDKRRELVIDVQALVGATLLGAQREITNLSSAVWVADSLKPSARHLSTLSARSDKGNDAVLERYRTDYRFVASRTVRGTIVPRALRLAVLTVKRKQFDQRHLLFALLELSPEDWPDIGRRVTAEELANTRAHVVERIGRRPEPDEDMDAWRALIADIPPASTGDPELSRQAIDRLRAQRDDPAADDNLGRAVFSQVIADNIVDVRQTQSRGFDRAFMVHLDGAWGSGKSSVLLQVEKNLKARKPDPWLVVTFNAWQNQYIDPPWWAVICQIVAQVRGQLHGWRKWHFKAVWLWWKLRNDFAPLVLAALLIGLGLLLLGGERVFVWLGQSSGGEAAPVSQFFRWLGGFLGGFGTMKDVVGVLTTVGGLAALGRSLLFGSAATGQAVEKLRDDPYTPVKHLFARLIAVADRPVLVIIDDLDRCNADYVVSLLETIQTMLRQAPITYLAAGDRKWLTTSFEKRYADFRRSLDGPAKPLGHLFLEKVFQLSVAIPQLGGEAAHRFWQGLVNRSAQATVAEEPSDQQREEARKIIADEQSETAFQQQIDAATDPAFKKALLTEAALRVASPEFAGNLESRYARYGLLLERNPRAIKRLVNKLALNISVLFLEARRFTAGPLARWTIIEMRWPILADALRDHPEWLDDFAKADKSFANLKDDVNEVLGTKEAVDEKLNSAALKQLLGL